MIGRTLSHYEILGEISRGGMGIVYRARDVKLQREVAIKVLPPELVSDEDRKRRFVQEARAASKLRHPNIAVIHEIDEADGVTFIAMELIEGEQLSQRLDRAPVPLGEALRLAKKSRMESPMPTTRASCTATSSPTTYEAAAYAEFRGKSLPHHLPLEQGGSFRAGSGSAHQPLHRPSEQFRQRRTLTRGSSPRLRTLRRLRHGGQRSRVVRERVGRPSLGLGRRLERCRLHVHRVLSPTALGSVRLRTDSVWFATETGSQRSSRHRSRFCVVTTTRSSPFPTRFSKSSLGSIRTRARS